LQCTARGTVLQFIVRGITMYSQRYNCNVQPEILLCVHPQLFKFTGSAEVLQFTTIGNTVYSQRYCNVQPEVLQFTARRMTMYYNL
jgi:hypothetical protein